MGALQTHFILQPPRRLRVESPLLVILRVVLRDSNMAAACGRVLCKVGRTLVEAPVTRRAGTISYLVGTGGSQVSRRAYGTGGTRFRSRLLSEARGAAGGNGLLGCAVLLGGGLGLYQTVRFWVQQNQHLAQEEVKVRGRGC